MGALLGVCAIVLFIGLFGVLGLAFLIDGLWQRYSIKEGICPRCRYDLSGIIALRRCPECGHGFHRLADTARYVYRRNYYEVAIGVVLLAIALVWAFRLFR